MLADKDLQAEYDRLEVLKDEVGQYVNWEMLLIGILDMQAEIRGLMYG